MVPVTPALPARAKPRGRPPFGDREGARFAAADVSGGQAGDGCLAVGGVALRKAGFVLVDGYDEVRVPMLARGGPEGLRGRAGGSDENHVDGVQTKVERAEHAGGREEVRRDRRRRGGEDVVGVAAVVVVAGEPPQSDQVGAHHGGRARRGFVGRRAGTENERFRVVGGEEVAGRARDPSDGHGGFRRAFRPVKARPDPAWRRGARAPP